MPRLIATSGPGRADARIQARGFEPVPLAPPPGADVRQGVCAAAQGIAEALASPAAARFSGAVLATRCDQLRRAIDRAAPAFVTPWILLNLPATAGTPAAICQEAAELDRLDAFLDALIPGTPSERPAPASQTPVPDAPGAIRIGLVSCTRTTADARVVAMLGELGMAVVYEAACCAPAPGMPAIWHRPNAPYFAALADAARHHRLRAWVAIQQPWCDLQHAEAPRLKRDLGAPCLVLDTGPSPAMSALRTRAEAFREMLAP